MVFFFFRLRRHGGGTVVVARCGGRGWVEVMAVCFGQ
jgi:hypothetical protein